MFREEVVRDVKYQRAYFERRKLELEEQLASVKSKIAEQDKYLERLKKEDENDKRPDGEGYGLLPENHWYFNEG